MKRNEIKKIALSSLMCVLSVILCTLGCLFDVADLCACTAASVIVAAADIEFHGKYPYLIYAVSSALLLILFPTASATLFYVLFFGYYPLLDRLCKKLTRWLSFLLKYVVFNGAIVVSYILMTRLLLSVQAGESRIMLFTLWLFANIFFTVFDFALSVFMLAYTRVYRKRWGIDKWRL